MPGSQLVREKGERVIFYSSSSGTVRPFSWGRVLIGGVFVVSMSVLASTARAQEHRPYNWLRELGHRQHHDNAYSKWMKPYKPDESCCNMKVRNADGSVSGDCYPTTSRRVRNRDGDRLIARKDNDEWVEIPDHVILRRTLNPDESGVSSHICENGKVVLCFLESTGTL